LPWVSSGDVGDLREQQSPAMSLLESSDLARLLAARLGAEEFDFQPFRTQSWRS